MEMVPPGLEGKCAMPWSRWGGSLLTTVPLSVLFPVIRQKKTIEAQKKTRTSRTQTLQEWRFGSRITSKELCLTEVLTKVTWMWKACLKIVAVSTYLCLITMYRFGNGCSYVLCYLSVSFPLSFVPPYIMWKAPVESCWIFLASSLPF